MNGKFILVVMICMNLFAFFVSIGYAQTGSNTAIGSFYLIEMFVDEQTITDAAQTYNEQQGLSLSDNVTTAVEGLTTEKSAGSVISDLLPSGVSTFLDVVQMILGVASLLTPLPLLAFLNSLALPLWVLFLIGVPISILYMIALAEFVGAREF